MTEPTTDPGTAAPEAVTDPAQDASTLPPWARDAISKANQEAAKYRTKVKELEPLADQFRRLEDASKSEAQRLAEAAETAKRDAESARAEAIRYRVAATHKLDADDFDLLGSGTEEEITGRAQRIAALKAASAAPAPSTVPPSRPVEQLRPGATPSDAETAEDVIYNTLFGSR